MCVETLLSEKNSKWPPYVFGIKEYTRYIYLTSSSCKIQNDRN